MDQDGIALHFIPTSSGYFEGFIAVVNAELRPVGAVDVQPIEPIPLIEEAWTDADQEVEPAFVPADDGDKLFVFLSRVERYGYLLASTLEDSTNPFDPFSLLD